MSLCSSCVSLRLLFVLVYFPVAVIKYPEGEGFILVDSSRVQSIMIEKSEAKLETAGHIVSTVKEQRE